MCTYLVPLHVRGLWFSFSFRGYPLDGCFCFGVGGSKHSVCARLASIANSLVGVSTVPVFQFSRTPLCPLLFVFSCVNWQWY